MASYRADPDRIFATAEIHALRENANITFVDGIPAEALRARPESQIFEAVRAQSEALTANLRIAVDSNGEILRIGEVPRIALDRNRKGTIDSAREWNRRHEVVRRQARPVRSHRPSRRVGQRATCMRAEPMLDDPIQMRMIERSNDVLRDLQFSLRH